MIREYIMFTLVGICLILIVFAFITKSMSKKRKLILILMASTAIVQLISDRLSYHYNGDITALGVILTRVSKFLAYAAYLFIIYIFNKYVNDLLLTEGELPETPKLLRLTELILAIGTTVLIVSQFTGFYYFYDENNVYTRASGYFVSYLFPTFTIIVQLVAIIKYRKNLRKKLFTPILLFTIMPLVASVFQFFIHGVSLTTIFLVGMIALLYCFSVLDANELIETAHQKEVDALKEKQRNVDIMIEQTISALVEAIDAKDRYTNGHSRRVADFSRMIAKEAEKSEAECEKIHRIALLHDIGKIGIPDAIINKQGKLTDEEYAVIKTHPKIGREILEKITISPELAIGASFHHERYDGKGYPFGLKGEEIPEIARIIAVADSYDAMASKRSYRDMLPKETILGELEKGSGTQFDPEFTEIMMDLVESDAI